MPTGRDPLLDPKKNDASHDFSFDKTRRLMPKRMGRKVARWDLVAGADFENYLLEC